MSESKVYWVWTNVLIKTNSWREVLWKVVDFFDVLTDLFRQRIFLTESWKRIAPDKVYRVVNQASSDIYWVLGKSFVA